MPNKKDLKRIHELRQFVIENRMALCKDPYDLKKLKIKKYQYFVQQLQNEFGNPHWQEIAQTLIKLFIKTKKIVNVEHFKKVIKKYEFAK